MCDYTVFGHVKYGLVRDLNPGPLAPEARIIPLDQRANTPASRLQSLQNSKPNY